MTKRISGNYAKDINLKQGTSIDLRKKDDKVVIASPKVRLNLQYLLTKITAKNIHEEEFAGGDVGKETNT